MVGVLAAATCAALAAAHVLGRMQRPYKGFAESERFVEIPPGSSASAIRRRLVDEGVVSDEFAFRAAVVWAGRSRRLQAGEYRFTRPMSAVEVVEAIARGAVYAHPVTFPEGLTIREMGAIYQARGFGKANEFVAAAQQVSLIADLDAEADDLEGYLFPETYALSRGTAASTLITMMVDRFRSTYAELLSGAEGSSALTVRQVVTLASLVEKETAKAAERTIVAAVYQNRLRRKMALQADPTVVYALVKAGTYDGNIRRRDLAFDSPYNTYKYPGLPPGPIASPGRASLTAALAPADVSYLYFVSRNDGSHVFADTLRQHNANVYEHQVLYFRRQRLEQRRQ